MPATEVFFFKDEDGSVPVLEWLSAIRERSERAFRKCFGLIRLLEDFGHELRRPRADMLRDGVYELRTKSEEKQLPTREIEQAAARIEMYRTDPEAFRLSVNEEGNENG